MTELVLSHSRYILYFGIKRKMRSLCVHHVNREQEEEVKGGLSVEGRHLRIKQKV